MKKPLEILRFVLICLVLKVGFGVVAAAPPDSRSVPVGRPNIKLYTDQDGIPQNKVLSLERDADGFLWVGTGNGVAYFNGVKWKRVEIPNPTASSGVRVLSRTSDGSLWFGTISGGLHRLKDGRWSTFDKAGGALPSDRIRTLLETKRSDGTLVLWVGTGGGGLVRFDGAKWTVFNKANSGLPDDNVECLCQTILADGTPVLWAGTGQGLAWFSGNVWNVYNTKNTALQSDRIGGLIETVSASGEKALWVGTLSGGLSRLIGNQWETFTPANSPILNTSVHRLAPARSATGGHAFWAGTPGGGVFKYDDGKWTLYNRANTALPDDAVDAIRTEISPEGLELVWVGLFNSGLIRLSEDGFRTFDSRNVGLPSDIVTSMLETADVSGQPVRWFGTDGGGAARFSDGKWTMFDKRNSGLPSDQIYGFAEIREEGGAGGIWIATNDGLVRFENDHATQVWTTTNSGVPGNQVYAVCEELVTTPGKPTLWVGTLSAGLARFMDGQWKTFNPTNSDFPGTVVRAFLPLTLAGRPTIAVATRGNGVCFYLDGKWKTLDRNNSALPNNDVEGLALITDLLGRPFLAVGTLGGACQIPLDRSDPVVEPLFGGLPYDLPNKAISKLVAGKNGLYVFSLKGVTRLRLTRTGVESRSYSVEDGLPSNEVIRQAGMVDAAGKVWAGTTSGIAVLQSETTPTDAAPSVARIERVTVNGVQIGKTRDLPWVGLGAGGLAEAALSYSENNIVFEYALPRELKGSDARFRVQLKEFEAVPSDWTSELRKEYTNLGAGNYTFTVWAKDSLGREAAPLEVNFRIRPAPWRTWWAYAGYLVISLGAGYLGVQARLRTLRLRNLQLEARIAERTSQLAEKNEELVSAKNALEVRNLEMAQTNEELKKAKVEVERKNAALDGKIAELARKNDELVKSQQQANRIFSALAEALPGTVLDDKYRLDFRIGSGGFGVVFRGTHVRLNRPIAIKVFRPQPGNDSPEALERFQREGMSACRINHPNAVNVIDSGVSSDGIAYLVMELLSGVTLADEVRRVVKFSPKRCAEILIPVCDVLASAHASGVIHRDIKPDNIFLHQNTGGETVKVVDFGVAKMMEDTEGSGGAPLTGFGGIVGTAHYIAPERINSLPYDGRSDVYSVGVMLYQLLTGEMPYEFDDSGFVGIALKHLTQSPRPPRRFRPDLTPEMEALLLRTLAKRPEERPDAEELCELLQTVFLASA